MKITTSIQSKRYYYCATAFAAAAAVASDQRSQQIDRNVINDQVYNNNDASRERDTIRSDTIPMCTEVEFHMNTYRGKDV